MIRGMGRNVKCSYSVSIRGYKLFVVSLSTRPCESVCEFSQPYKTKKSRQHDWGNNPNKTPIGTVLIFR